ncbi:hypothetical protein [Halobacillus naozhouensis]|uniref:Uncharacterized protein n=1 Tax=Halobacillus naozhouensis TaxID=554880 RepID=A0ABY8J1M2_9BACI|nr:hypothetical protein [Halobacillus naozhouensis]WFT75439.1 hypothetical protein P9989_03305 [Halobacillus naozhouensis]
MVSSRLVEDAYQVGDQFLNYTIRKPLGIAGLITPWKAKSVSPADPVGIYLCENSKTKK